MEDTLVPLYLLHRYQTEAAAKEVGGLNYHYLLRGDGQRVSEIVSPADQKKALVALLKTLTPETLTFPESLLTILPPRPPAYPRTPESFTAHTGVTFDPSSATEAAAEITVGLLFNPQRASRLVEYHARDARNPSLQEVIEATVNATWKAPQLTGMQAETQAVTETVVAEHLLALAAGSEASAEARAIARSEVVSLRGWIAGHGGDTADEKALRDATLARIDFFLKDPEKFKPAPAPTVPPGQPIGQEEEQEE